MTAFKFSFWSVASRCRRLINLNRKPLKMSSRQVTASSWSRDRGWRGHVIKSTEVKSLQKYFTECKKIPRPKSFLRRLQKVVSPDSLQTKIQQTWGWFVARKASLVTITCRTCKINLQHVWLDMGQGFVPCLQRYVKIFPERRPYSQFHFVGSFFLLYYL